MKITATREELLGPVQNVIGVVERRQTQCVQGTGNLPEIPVDDQLPRRVGVQFFRIEQR